MLSNEKKNGMYDCNISFSNYNFYYKKKKIYIEQSFVTKNLSPHVDKKNIKILKTPDRDKVISFTNFANRLYVNRFISADIKLLSSSSWRDA